MAALELSIKMHAASWLAGNSFQVVNIVTCTMESRFPNIYSTFFVAANVQTYRKYYCRIHDYLFCIYANLYKHKRPSYYKPDVQSMKLCYRSSNGIFSQFYFHGSGKYKWIQLRQFLSYRYNFFDILLWKGMTSKPSQRFLIFELFRDQILWRTRNNGKFYTFFINCAISEKICHVSKNARTVF